MFQFLKIQIENLHSAIKQLPEIQQRRMEMYYFEDMTYEQIAKREMCSKVAIKYSVTRAIENLKKYFN